MELRAEQSQKFFGPKYTVSSLLLFICLITVGIVSCKPRVATSSDVQFIVTDPTMMINAGYTGPALITGEPNLRIRKTPSRRGRRQGRALYGEVVQVLEVQGEFARINRGWVDKRWLQLTKYLTPGYMGEAVAVNEPATQVFDIRQNSGNPINTVSFGQIVKVTRVNANGFAETELGAIPAQHLVRLKGSSTFKEEVAEDLTEIVPAPKPETPILPLANAPVVVLTQTKEPQSLIWQ